MLFLDLNSSLASSLSSPDLVSVAQWIQDNWPTVLAGTGLGAGLLLLLGASRTARTGAIRVIQILIYGVGAVVILVGILYHCARRAAQPVLSSPSNGSDDDSGQDTSGHPAPEDNSDEAGGSPDASPPGHDASGGAPPSPLAGVPDLDDLLSGAGCGEAAGGGAAALADGVPPAGRDQGDVAPGDESLPCPSGFRHWTRSWARQLQGDPGQPQSQGGGEMELELM